MKKLYPIGTIADTKGESVMIVGLMVKANNSIYDYCGVRFPFGYRDSEEMILFNHKDIIGIRNVGYMDDCAKAYMIKLQNEMRDINDVSTIKRNGNKQ